MKTRSEFIAVVLAADRTANDPVASKTGVACKAIAPVGGTPMIIRVLDALEASGMVKDNRDLRSARSRLFPTARNWKSVFEPGASIWVPNLDSPSRSANSALAQVDQHAPVLLTTADHALLTPAIVQHFLTQIADGRQRCCCRRGQV